MNIIPDIKNPEYLRKAYLDEGKSTYTIAEECRVTKSTAYYHLKKNGLIGIKSEEIKVKVDETLFSINDPVFCYYAGLVSADGYLDLKYHRVVLRMKNEDWNEMLNKLRDYFKLSSEVRVYRTRGYSGEIDMCDLTISSKKLIDTLKELNITHNKKDLKRRFPDMEKLRDECQEMYMRGLIDGDGSIHASGWCSILEESKEMMDAIGRYIKEKYNIEFRERKVETNNGKQCIEFFINRANTKKMLDALYKHNLNYKLDYKYRRYLSLQ